MKVTKVILGIFLSLVISGLPTVGVSLLLEVPTSAQGHEALTTAHKTTVQIPEIEKVPGDLRSIIDTNRDPKRLYDVIVQTAEPPTPSHRRIIEGHGGEVKHQFQSINSLLIEIPLARSSPI